MEMKCHKCHWNNKKGQLSCVECSTILSNAPLPTSPLDRLVMRRQYAEAVDPYIKAKVKIYSMALPTFIADAAGNIHTSYKFDEATQNTLDQLDELIENARSKHLGV